MSEASFAEQKLQIPNNPFKLQLKNQKQGQNVIGSSLAQILLKSTQHFFFFFCIIQQTSDQRLPS